MMDSSRREMMGALAVAASALPGVAHAVAAAERRPARPTFPALFPPKPVPAAALVPDGRIPVNRERAYRMMKEAGVDAIIGGGDANSRYLTNMRSVTSEMGSPLRTIGIMSADPKQPIVAVTPLVDIGRYTGPGREWPEIITYSAAAQPDRYKDMRKLSEPDTIVALDPRGWPVSATSPLTPTEQLWTHNEKTLPTANAATAELAVRKVLVGMGLTRATIAIDDAALAEALPRLGMDDLKIVPGENLFRRIRQVKSAVEIDRMRVVAKLNDSASRTMMGQLTPGMTFEDVQAVFFTEVAKRGGRPEFIVAGMTSGLRNGRLVKHEPFLVDCCGNFDGYSGDFARTVVLGTPSNLLIDRSKILGRVAVEMTGMLKPGIHYHEITSRGREMAKKLGADFPISFGPHSVGLAHSDDPLRDDVPFQARPDIVLEPGMVITVDLPTLEQGWGSMHLESLILITKDGAEWLDRYDDPLYEVQV